MAPLGLYTGQDDSGGGKEGGHAGQDEDGAKVIDCLGGLHFFAQLLLFHFFFSETRNICYTCELSLLRIEERVICSDKSTQTHWN